jgi:hypothetical protein
MIFKTAFPAKHPNKQFSYKLCRLLSFLNHTSYEYEKVADEMQNKDGQLALQSIATETKQYATELNAQLQCLDIPYLAPSGNFNSNEVSAYVHAISSPGDDHVNLADICYENEHSLIDAYRDVLNEYTPFPFIKQMIEQQFTGVKTAFMKLRLLDLIQFKS